MPKKQTEANIEDQIVKYVESLGGEALKLRIDGRNGWHDRTIWLAHVPAFTIEVKKPGGEPSDAQLFWMDRLHGLHQYCFIVDNFGDAKTCVDEMSNDFLQHGRDLGVCPRSPLAHVIKQFTIPYLGN